MQCFHVVVLLFPLNFEHKFHTVLKDKKNKNKAPKTKQNLIFYVGYAFLLLKCQQEIARQAQDEASPFRDLSTLGAVILKNDRAWPEFSTRNIQCQEQLSFM